MSKNTVTVDADNFETEVLEAREPVLVDFWAPWCGPCLAIGPLLEELAGQYAGRVKVVKIDVDEQPELAAAFRIRSIPSLFALVNGEVVDHMVGFGGKKQLEQAFETLARMSQNAEATHV